jgi:hypothetical protein
MVHTLALMAGCLGLTHGETLPQFLKSEKPAGKLGSASIKEASGLAVSSLDAGFLWVINDSGSKPELHLIETNGRYRGKTTLSGARNVDWEDLASFQLGGKPFLLAADTGDNESKRDSCTLYILNEPEMPAGDKTLDHQSRVQWQIRFRYEDGPRDCESVAVDAAAGKILLLSKRTEVPFVYELPLKPEDDTKVLTARKIGKTSVQAPTGNRIPFANQPTGFDLTPDASLAAVVTYYGVFVFPKKPDETWASAFARDQSRPAPTPPSRSHRPLKRRFLHLHHLRRLRHPDHPLPAGGKGRGTVRRGG